MPVLAAPFYAVMGCMAMGHEYRYGTNKATLTAIPDRIAVLAAKALVLLAWVLVTVIATLLLNLAHHRAVHRQPDVLVECLRGRSSTTRATASGSLWRGSGWRRSSATRSGPS